MSVKLLTLSFNSDQQPAMSAFFESLGAAMTKKQVRAGSEVYKGSLAGVELVIYGIAKKEKAPSPDFSLRIEVAKIEPIVEKLKSVPGVQVVMDIEMMPDGKKAIVLDPDGHSVEIVEAWVE